jgi:XTP/dITP diphosphohydrolase
VTLFCATSNPGKLREFKLAATGVCLIQPLPGLSSIQPPAETGSTFEENAIAKARAYGAYNEGWVFAEDSGLEIDALNGAPGVYSARYSGPDATDEANNRLVLERMAGQRNRAARYVCVIALVHDGRLVRVFRGVVEGEILEEPRGGGGFGYDPIFFFPPFGCSFGEIAAERKQTVSHRGAALKSMLDFLRTVSWS